MQKKKSFIILLRLLMKSFTTGPVTKETLAYIANIEEGSVAPTVQKLRKKNLIKVYLSKSSKGGFVNYKLPINNIAAISDILHKENMSREVLDMDYEYRDRVAKLTGHKKLIVCHLVSIVQSDLTAGQATIEDLLSIVGTTSNETVRKCMRELINTKFFEKEKGADYQYYKLNKKLIDSVKCLSFL